MSSILLMVVIISFLLFFFVIIAFFNPFKNKKLNTIYKVICYTLSIAVIMFVLSLKSRFADDIQLIKATENNIFVLDYYERGDDYTEYVYRLYMVDKKSGKKFNRKYLGEYVDIIFISDSFVTELTFKKRGFTGLCC